MQTQCRLSLEPRMVVWFDVVNSVEIGLKSVMFGGRVGGNYTLVYVRWYVGKKTIKDIVKDGSAKQARESRIATSNCSVHCFLLFC